MLNPTWNPSELNEKIKYMDFEISMTNTKVQSLADEKNKIDTLEESLQLNIYKYTRGSG